MADRNLDEYESLKFYAKHTKPKTSGFSKFQVENRYYFCRYVDGDIAMISQAYLVSELAMDRKLRSVLAMTR